MKRGKIAQVSASLFLLSFCYSCALSSSYLSNRGRDAADIFTATIGSGAGGVKVKAGPLQGGLLCEGICLNYYGGYVCDTQTKGLRGGEWLNRNTEKREFAGWETNFDYQYFIYGMECFRGGDKAIDRGKTRAAFTFGLLTFPVPEDLFYRNRKPEDPDHRLAKFSPLPYFFDVEVALGFGYIFRFGLNFAELIDFLLGVTTLDIFGDDLYGITLEK